MDKRPNVLLIWTDEQRPDTMACYGNDFIQTPHLNRFASESAVFQHAYCTQPVCTPSRASILTGVWPHTHGSIENNVPLPSHIPTLAEMLGDEYYCAYYGKWHLGNELSPQRGFSEWVSIEDIYGEYISDPDDRNRQSDYCRFLIDEGFAPNVRTGNVPVFSRSYAAALAPRYTKATFLGERAAEFLARHDQERPFFLSVNFLEPHMPFLGPLNYLHDPDEIPVGPAFAQAPPPEAALRNRLRAAAQRRSGTGGFPLENERDWRRLRANYYGLVSLVDQAVGRILGALEQSGLADSTIVIFTSDHGEMMGDHALVGKQVMYEESVGVPLIVRVPWINGSEPRARRIPGRVSQIDLVPTILDLVGAPIPAHIQGKSRAPVLRGEETLADNDVFIEWNGSSGSKYPDDVPRYTLEQRQSIADQVWRTVITADGWKLNLCRTDQCELYNLNEDPHELENLYARPEHRARVQELTERIVAWQSSVGDEASLVEQG